MKQNVNIGLLGIIMTLLFFMILIVIVSYFSLEGKQADYEVARKNLENVSQQINQTQQDLAEREAQLQEKQRALLEYQGELNLSKGQVQTLGGFYSGAQSKLNTTMADLNNTKNERDQWIAKADQYNTEKQQCQLVLNQKSSDLDVAQNKIIRMRSYASDINGKLAMMDQGVSSITDSVSTISSTASNVQGFSNSTVKGWGNDIKGQTSRMTSNIADLNSYLVQLQTIANNIQGS